MGRFIVKHTMPDGTDLYQIWSTIVDAPVTDAGSLDSLKKFWREEYGRQGIEDLERRIESRGDAAFSTVDDVASYNRAGKDETRLTKEQIVDYYFVQRGVDDPPLGKSWLAPEEEVEEDES